MIIQVVKPLVKQSSREKHKKRKRNSKEIQKKRNIKSRKIDKRKRKMLVSKVFHNNGIMIIYK